MADKRKVLQHIKSHVVTDGVPKLPTADQISYGEIALNYGSNYETLSIKNDADNIVSMPIKDWSEQIAQIAQTISTMTGFARVNGDSSTSPKTVYGDADMTRSIGSHLRLAAVKDGKVVKYAKAGRLTLATDGTEIALDGTDGDIMLVCDTPLEFMKATDTVEDVNLNMMGLSFNKSTWNGHSTKTVKSWAITPDETVHCSLDGDTRSQAHSIYNTSISGTYSAPSTLFTSESNAAYKSSGAGMPVHYVSGKASVQQAQNKNTDELTNRPYMGLYYEYPEIICTMLFSELGSLAENSLANFGTGVTPTQMVSATTFYDEAISGNSGAKFMSEDGATVMYKNTYGNTINNGGADGTTTTYLSDGFFGNGGSRYCVTEMLEPQRICDAIVKAGLTEYIGTYTNIFYYDDNGDMTVSTDGSINPADGTGMTVGKKYFVVRDVPNCEGLADNVMTAVINVYVLMNCADGVMSDDKATAMSKAVVKYSLALYRGWSLPKQGCFRQLQGLHHEIQNEGGTYTSKFLASSDVSNVPAWTNFGSTAPHYGLITDTLEYENGLDLSLGIGTSSEGWVKTADYGISLFCGTSKGGSYGTYENRYQWNAWSRGIGENNRPADGYKSFNASVLGCVVSHDRSSVRTLSASGALSHGADAYAGGFAVPYVG